MEDKLYRLDRLDKELLYWMDIDCRQSLASLAKKMRTSPAKLSYRIEQLKKSGAIHAFDTLINYRKIGYRGHAVYYKLKEMSDAHRDKLVGKIKKIPKVVDVLITDGAYDLQIVCLAKVTDEVAEALWAMREVLDRYVLEEMRVVHLKTHFFTHENFLEKPPKKAVKPRIVLDVAKEGEELDGIDDKILTVICKHADWPTWKIAKHAGVGGPTVYNRIKRLEQRGIIIGYTAKISPSLPSYFLYRVFVQLRYIPKSKREELMGYLDQNDAIYRSSFTFGDYDLYYDARLANASKLRDLLSEVYEHSPDDIVRQDWIRVYKIEKFGFYPKALESEKE